MLLMIFFIAAGIAAGWFFTINALGVATILIALLNVYVGVAVGYRELPAMITLSTHAASILFLVTSWLASICRDTRKSGLKKLGKKIFR